MKELHRDFAAVVVLACQGEGVLSTEVQVEFLVQMEPCHGNSILACLSLSFTEVTKV